MLKVIFPILWITLSFLCIKQGNVDDVVLAKLGDFDMKAGLLIGNRYPSFDAAIKELMKLST